VDHFEKPTAFGAEEALHSPSISHGLSPASSKGGPVLRCILIDLEAGSEQSRNRGRVQRDVRKRRQSAFNDQAFGARPSMMPPSDDVVEQLDRFVADRA